MIFEKEFIWYEDHYAYYITEKSNIDMIREKGLIPLCGERSNSVVIKLLQYIFLIIYIVQVIGLTGYIMTIKKKIRIVTI